MWDGCIDRLDPKWNPSNEPESNITTATPEYDAPVVLASSKDDE